MIEKITSVFDNYKGKINNPFIGTIISVWLIHNWRIPYALVTFDKECTMQDKMNFITDYFAKQNFWEELFNVIGFSFLVLIFTFILMAFSRIITDSYYKILEPFLITKIDLKAIFTQEEKAVLELKIKELETSLNSKREEVTRTESNNQIITMKRDSLQNELQALRETNSQEINKLNDDYNTLHKKHASALKITNHYDSLINFFSQTDIDNIRKVFTDNPSLNSPSFSPTVSKVFIENGFFTRQNDKSSFNIAGRLFIEYFKDTRDELPF